MLKSGLNHPKMLLLAKLLGEEVVTARGIMESLWQMTAELAPRGNIGKFSSDQIVSALHWRGIHSSLTVNEIMQAIVDAGFLDPHPEFGLLCHDWPRHCDHYVHRKLALETLYFCDGSIPSLKRIATAQRPEILKAYARNGKPVSDPAPEDDGFAKFYALYPRKRHKERARGQWQKIVLDASIEQQILHALSAQLTLGMFSDEVKRNPYPGNWLKARAWEDALEPQEREVIAEIEDRDPADNPADIATALGLNSNG